MYFNNINSQDTLHEYRVCGQYFVVCIPDRYVNFFKVSKDGESGERERERGGRRGTGSTLEECTPFTKNHAIGS